MLNMYAREVKYFAKEVMRNLNRAIDVAYLYRAYVQHGMPCCF